MHDHHILVTQVGVAEHAQPRGCLQQCHSNLTLELSRSPMVSAIPTQDFLCPARCQYPHVTVAAMHRLLRGRTWLSRHLTSSHKRRHPVATVSTISAETPTVKAAVDPVTVPSNVHDARTTLQSHRAQAHGCQLPAPLHSHTTQAQQMRELLVILSALRSHARSMFVGSSLLLDREAPAPRAILSRGAAVSLRLIVTQSQWMLYCRFAPSLALAVQICRNVLFLQGTGYRPLQSVGLCLT